MRVSEFKKDVFILNEYGANLQDLNTNNVILSNDDYGTTANYEIKFKPYCTSKTYYHSIVLSYPGTINPSPDTLSGNCYVKAGDH